MEEDPVLITQVRNLGRNSLREVVEKLEEYSVDCTAVRTYTETCRKNGINEYEALERLMAGNPYTMQEILAGVT